MDYLFNLSIILIIYKLRARTHFIKFRVFQCTEFFEKCILYICKCFIKIYFIYRKNIN